MTNAMASDLIGQRNLRVQKLNQLRQMGVDPFPAKSYKQYSNKEVVDSFEKFENQEVILAGRITAWRGHGKLSFIDLTDDSGKIQVYIKQEELNPTDVTNPAIQFLGFDDLALLDMHDYIEVTGKIVKTQRGEISIEALKIRILSKTIRPLPEDLTDKEERFRRRYVDMKVNPEVKERMKRRALFWEAHREFFNTRGFYEVNIPVLEHVPGGGDAVPFTTHMNAIDQDFFLRISHELPLKRLIGAGFEKVYDIGARFRNEGLSDEHLPEHVAMEFYWAYADWKDGMKLIQELFTHIINRVYNGQMQFKIREFDVDFSKPWEIIDFNEVFKKTYGVKDIYDITIEEVKDLLQKNDIKFDRSVNIARGVDALWKKIRKTIGGPSFLINHPKYLSPLQKPSLENPNMVERFQPIIAGSELGNGWSEVNDPIDQYERFLEQQKLRDSGDAEAQWLDIDYVEMLEYGMPPTFGYGHAERDFWFLENVTAREGVPFPQLKLQYDSTTQEIYPEAFEVVESLRLHAAGERNQSKENANAFNTTGSTDLKNIQVSNKVTINPEVLQKFNGIKTGFIILENINVEKANEELSKFKESITQKVVDKYSNVSDIKSSKNLQSFRDVYKAFGVDPNSRLNSSEALIRRVVSGKGLYNINNVVDTYNMTSVEFELPMAAYDLDKVVGKIQLRFANQGEEIIKIGDEEASIAEAGELVYSDDQGIICLDFNYRDSDRTKITNETRNIIVFVDGTSEITFGDLKSALETLAYRIVKFCGGNIKEYGIIPNEGNTNNAASKVNSVNGKLPTREEALKLLSEHVKDEYQILHAKMVGAAMEAWALRQAQDDKSINIELWYLTGLLHDLDYYEHPTEHPGKSLVWFKEWGYPDELIHAVEAHAFGFNGFTTKPQSKMAAALIACDELSGFLYAYSLMRPTRFEGMDVKGVEKRLKDKSFAAKINRDDIEFGITEFGVERAEHIALLIETFKGMGI